MTQTRSILQSDFTMTKAKILETLEEKWNDIDRKAITYEVKHQETASSGTALVPCFEDLSWGKNLEKKGGNGFLDLIYGYLWCKYHWSFMLGEDLAQESQQTLSHIRRGKGGKEGI